MGWKIELEQQIRELNLRVKEIEDFLESLGTIEVKKEPKKPAKKKVLKKPKVRLEEEIAEA